jgi:hypothetical protein
MVNFFSSSGNLPRSFYAGIPNAIDADSLAISRIPSVSWIRFRKSIRMPYRGIAKRSDAMLFFECSLPIPPYP